MQSPSPSKSDASPSDTPVSQRTLTRNECQFLRELACDKSWVTTVDG
jgi:hypothetical protein